MKRSYTPTVADNLTGQNLRALRNRRGETLKQTVENSGFGKDASTLAATERGERLLTELEATKLAAHFNTTADSIRARPAEILTRPIEWTPATEQDWLGNREVTTTATTTPLFAVPDADRPELQLRRAADDFEALFAAAEADVVVIHRSNPMTPDEYRLTVWIPYLEARYTADTA